MPSFLPERRNLFNLFKSDDLIFSFTGSKTQILHYRSLKEREGARKKAERGRVQLELERNFSPWEGVSHLDQKGKGLASQPFCEKELISLARSEKGHSCFSTHCHPLGPTCPLSSPSALIHPCLPLSPSLELDFSSSKSTPCPSLFLSITCKSSLTLGLPGEPLFALDSAQTLCFTRCFPDPSPVLLS